MYRLDYPLVDDNMWLYILILKHKEGSWQICKKPVQADYLPLSTG